MSKLLKLLVFIPMTIIFLPAFLVVNSLNDIWSEMMGELFGL